MAKKGLACDECHDKLLKDAQSAPSGRGQNDLPPRCPVCVSLGGEEIRCTFVRDTCGRSMCAEHLECLCLEHLQRTEDDLMDQGGGQEDTVTQLSVAAEAPGEQPPTEEDEGEQAQDEEDDDEEYLDPLSQAEAEQDPLFGRKIKRKFHGVWVKGVVHEIEIGAETKERFYYIQYADGEAEHMTAEEVRQYSDPADDA